MVRPDIDEYFLKMAQLIAERSTCLRRRIGSVLVKDKQILSTGYNGAPKDHPHCLDIGCIREELEIKSGTELENCRAVHAEMNAIIQCALHGVSTEGATLYVNAYPCKICARMIINAGIKRVVTVGKYSDRDGLELLRKSGIHVDNY
ncbi:MAG: deoxycytidylate deaminase [Candidatus Ranarchaeia archaeon]